MSASSDESPRLGPAAPNTGQTRVVSRLTTGQTAAGIVEDSPLISTCNRHLINAL
jgi:hypothetical protein